MSNPGLSSSIQAGAERRTHFRWWFAVVLWFLLLVSYVDRTNISITGPLMVKDHVVTDAGLALANSLFLFMYGLSNVLGGYLGDRLGPRKVAAIALAWWSIMTLFTGLVWSTAALVLSRVLLGLGEGMHWPMNSKWVKVWFPPKERARANMFWEFGLTIGPIITGPLIAWMVLSFGSWRLPFYVLFAVGIVVMLPIVWFVAKDRPQESRYVSTAELAYIQEGAAEEDVPLESVTLRQVFRKLDFWLLLLNWSGMATVFYGLLFWLPKYLLNVRHITLHNTGIWNMLPYILMTVFLIITALLSDRWMKRAIFAGLATLVAALGLLLGTHTSNLTLAMVLISIASAMNGVVLPTVWSSLQKMFPRQNVGVGAGYLNGLENIISAIGTYILGISFAVGFPYLIIFAVVGGISGLILAARGY
ncbi:MFS transporter [Alicyclobacillus macrosporangiidus]|jgi:sugar phosphate permease|uniref:Sugar phosphate permease n=1 Tax=Alicyclobacillus macrosporangiidus TaxID=392015 RepID=A0A1I7HHQ8_9BACL|nr:MFS transporter [Alicyclobacillus macrosporangiidus]SFU60089.1 Sugar phosphate permease [Alicyclobacillus macrosporangiidus]